MAEGKDPDQAVNEARTKVQLCTAMEQGNLKIRWKVVMRWSWEGPRTLKRPLTAARPR